MFEYPFEKSWLKQAFVLVAGDQRLGWSWPAFVALPKNMNSLRLGLYELVRIEIC